MKKVININFQGRVVPIEESSFDMLKRYTDSLRLYFANEEGRDEIINDIESRIGELFQERLKNGATCITDEDVNVIINNMGRPEDFGDIEDQASSDTNKTYSNGQYGPGFQPITGNSNKRLYRDDNNRVLGGVCSGIAAYFNIEPVIVRVIFIVLIGAAFLPYLILWAFLPKSSNVINGVRKRLYRNPDEKIIAGVCSGIASYFNVNVWIPRALFLIPFITIFFKWASFGGWDFPNFVGFTFSPGSLIIYIILWLVIPEASTTSEKLEMKGEKVDLNSIKNSVVEEMKEVQQRMSRLGKEARTVATEKGSTMGSEMGHVAKRTGNGIGNVIVFLAKAFAYFVVGTVALFLVIGLFSVAIASIGIFPILTNYVLTDGWQTVFAWGTLIFFIGVPVVGIITWIIRRIAKIKRGSTMMRFSFIALWILGWFFVISLIASVSRDFKSDNNPDIEKIALVTPGTTKLEVAPFPGSKYYSNDLDFRFEPFADMEEDSVVVNNVRFKIVKSTTDSFEVTRVRFAKGRNRTFADTLARRINYKVEQVDSFLYVDRGISITTKDKFRNQFVEITIAVPVGKHIKLHKQLGRNNRVQFGPWDNNYWSNNWEDEEHGWDYGVEYVMEADGLYSLDGTKASDPEDNSRRYRFRNNRNNNIRIETDENEPGYRYDQTERKIDSLQQLKELQIQKAKDSLQRAKEEIDKSIQSLEEKTRREEAHTAPEFNMYSTLLDS